jgi:L-aspartate oxidase
VIQFERKPVFAAPSALSGKIVVLGAGLAGLFTALKLAPMPVTLISPTRFGEGASSAWAQAGIAAAVADGDSPEAHAEDTITAGAGIVDPEIAMLMAQEAPHRIEDLLRYGVPFDRDLEGRLSLSREAAHGRRRIVHVKGDSAGRAIMAALTRAALDTPSVTLMEGWSARKLLVDAGRVHGVSLISERGQVSELKAGAVVLATGGIGQLFAVTTNPAEARGQGLELAARAGAVIADAEFVQFHPTALDIGRDPAPLATEALRGSGALIVNGSGHRFLLDLHADAELGPRDIVARGVHEEVTSGRGAYLDCRGIENFAADFPTVCAACRSANLDPATDLLPIAPAAHYHMGGVLTDAFGRTSLQGLWACGEVASTGAHGANRLASNSLLEAVVFAARIAEDLSGLSFEASEATGAVTMDATEPTHGAESAFVELRAAMSRDVGVIRDSECLQRVLALVSRLQRRIPDLESLGNSFAAAKLIAAAALRREESRGAHFRKDFPEPRPELAKRSFLTLAEADDIAAGLPGAAPALAVGA